MDADDYERMFNWLIDGALRAEELCTTDELERATEDRGDD